MQKKIQENEIVIFTDGSSLGNPGPGGWGAIIAFPDKKRSERYIVELGGGEKKTTNNRMEMTATIEALSYVIEYYSGKTLYSLVVYTDSSYLIKGITTWIYAWERRGWIKKDGEPVKNDDLWRRLNEITKKIDIKWEHVSSHIGIAGNERADEIAQRFADESRISLKETTYRDYGVDIFSLESDPDLVENKKTLSKKNSRKPYSYVSSIEGKAISHKSWQDCQKRVKGVPKACFRKVYSQEEEIDLIDRWSC